MTAPLVAAVEVTTEAASIMAENVASAMDQSAGMLGIGTSSEQEGNSSDKDGYEKDSG
ncbi:hypothetical protein [Sabulicella glaciei]|uniref:Uncharacterized protein n=1 Tax=Sabulicella glaciei TaxID=2984948 RepID=A0ABT3NPC7_9PROT|nr:hypothetical protein [Roseococcus sp. MDT2-1-1]MCW8084002.1 hypothetical protein [Roseococcus sp. MDT2-1-1]